MIRSISVKKKIVVSTYMNALMFFFPGMNLKGKYEVGAREWKEKQVCIALVILSSTYGPDGSRVYVPAYSVI